jgi:hypothetical protein
LRQVGRPADEAMAALRGRGWRRAFEWTRPDGLGFTLGRHLDGVAETEPAAKCRGRPFPDEDRPCIGPLFESGSGVYRIASNERLVRARVSIRDHLARVHPKPDLEPLAKDGIVPHAVAKLERGGAGPGRVVIVGSR